MNTVPEKMAQLLAPLHLHHFECEDQSALHAHHQGAKQGGHFSLILVSDSFAQLNRLERHRCVHQLLEPLLLNKEIHALTLLTKTPAEYHSINSIQHQEKS